MKQKVTKKLEHQVLSLKLLEKTIMQQLNHYEVRAITGGKTALASTATNDTSDHTTRNKIIKWAIRSLVSIGAGYALYRQMTGGKMMSDCKTNELHYVDEVAELAITGIECSMKSRYPIEKCFLLPKRQE